MDIPSVFDFLLFGTTSDSYFFISNRTDERFSILKNLYYCTWCSLKNTSYCGRYQDLSRAFKLFCLHSWQGIPGIFVFSFLRRLQAASHSPFSSDVSAPNLVMYSAFWRVLFPFVGFFCHVMWWVRVCRATARDIFLSNGFIGAFLVYYLSWCALNTINYITVVFHMILSTACTSNFFFQLWQLLRLFIGRPRVFCAICLAESYNRIFTFRSIIKSVHHYNFRCFQSL